MNSFFASVEQQANPHLRGRPLGVCAYLHRFGCVIAASIEAKRLGIKVGMTVEEAKQACPSAVFVQNDPPKYRAVTSRVFALLHELTDHVEHYSIDEAFLDLTGWYRDAAEAAWALTRVRSRIRDEVGECLRCSIGIAPTRFLAKTASDIEKPNGLVVINHENIDGVLSQLDLEDVCGIGPRIRRRLERAGIRTLLELKHYPVANLIRLFGKNGFYLWCKVHGMEVEKITSPEESEPKSIGHSYCVPNRVNRERKVVAVLTRLTERAVRRMRQEGFLAGTISVAVGFRAFHDSAFDLVHLSEPAQDSFTLVGAACDLLRRHWQGEPISFLAVTLSSLARPNRQARLPDPHAVTRSPVPKRLAAKSWMPLLDRRRLVSDAVDLVRDRYGENSIMLGSMFGVGNEAPDRIGFRKTV